MASMLSSESRRLYSWWWDSHISPKNSKWLQENLTDMDAKVKTMIKLIEEDADSFARKAEMYYKKRPELMKLVEEFYRAYRALAERYDYATGELRHAQRTLAAAFPNQIPFGLVEESSSLVAGREPQTLEIPHPIRAFFDPDDQKNRSSGATHLHEIFLEGNVKEGEFYDMVKKDEKHVAQLSNKNQGLKSKILSESEQADKAECEIQRLKKILADMLAEKESLALQYRQSLEKFSNADEELNCALKESTRLNEKASKAEAEVHILREALGKLQAEKDACLAKQKDLISTLEEKISHAQEEAKRTDKRAVEAETEAHHLRNKLSRIESENEAGLLQYRNCLDRLSVLEHKIKVTEEEAEMFSEQVTRKEVEVEKLRMAVSELNEDKEASRVLYEQCLEKIRKLELDLSSAQEDVKRLNSEILIRAKELRNTAEVCVCLEKSNQSLKLEANNLAKKIQLKDQELCLKHEELEKLQSCVKDEHRRYAQVEATLQSLQTLQNRSQEEQRALALELKNGLQMLKDLEMCKSGLEEEMQQVKDENRSLNERNLSSTVSVKNMENEILGLRQMKKRLEDEVALHLGESTARLEEIFGLKEEIKGLNRSYEALMSQVELVGLNPESLGSSVKELQEENSRLKLICEQDSDDKEALSQKTEYVKELLEKNNALDCLLSGANSELEGLREKVKELQSSCQLLHGEKSAHVLEKTLVLSQLHIITVNMQKLMEKNNVLENSLSSANVELEGLREKSKALEELCQLLNDEKSNLVAERSILSSQLESVEQRLEDLNKRFMQFEDRYAGLEKEKEVNQSQVQELRVSLSMEKQERESFAVSSLERLTDLENQIHLLQEDNNWRKNEFQEELDKAVMAQFEIFILQRFVEDVEEKNCSLLVECEKHVEASKLADKLISELEAENLEQQVEEELLLVEIQNLRLAIYQVYLALDIHSDGGSKDKDENVQISVDDILSNIEDMKYSIFKYEDDKQQLLVENSIILTLLQQLKIEVQEMELDKTTLCNKYETMKGNFLKARNENLHLVEMNGQLRLEISKGDDRANILKTEVEGLCVKLGQLKCAYMELQDEYSQALAENKNLLKDLSDLEEDYNLAVERSNGMVLETLALDNVSTFFKNVVAERTADLRLLSEDLRSLSRCKNDLEKELIVLREKLETTLTENLLMKDAIEQLGLKLRDTENMKLELGLALEGINRKCEESEVRIETLERQNVKLSNDNANLNKEIECLYEVNGAVGMELDVLRGEIEERRIIEEKLTSELQERENESELWEAEATSFYFDLQVSNIRDVLFEDKVHELKEVCKGLEGESSSKDVEIEEMEKKVNVMERDLGGLRAQLLAYASVTSSLKENIASLEYNALSLANLIGADNQKSKHMVHGGEVTAHPHHRQSDPELMGDQTSLVPNGISDLMELQTRILAVEKVMVEDINRLAKRKRSSTSNKLKSGKVEVKSQGRSHEDQKSNREEKFQGNSFLMRDKLNLKSAKPEISEARKGILIRDIPLDQASDGSSSINNRSRSRSGYLQADNQIIEEWKTSPESRKSCRTRKQSLGLPYEPQIEKELRVDKLELPTGGVVTNQEGNKGKFLRRLSSDAQNLANLQTTVKDLMKRLETTKKSKKTKGIDFGTVREQLEEVEETILQLVNVNGELAGNIEKSSLSDGTASTEQEQAWRGSERIGRLQLEVQKIQCVLLKLDDEKKSKGKSRYLRAKNRTHIILRDFIHHGRSSGRQKKTRFCGCFTPSGRQSLNAN